jgi:hypothetical protein
VLKYAKALGISRNCGTAGNTKKNAKKKALIHYYMGEDAADNIRSDVSTEGVQKNVSLASFCELEYDDERNELNDLAQVLLKIARGERKPKDNVKSTQ